MVKRTAPFKARYAVELGLRVKERDPETKEVLTASCLFCELFGRETKAGAQRRPTDKVATFKPPFRKDSIQIHLVGQHPTHWGEYCALSSDDSKRAYFIAAGATMDLNVETNQDAARPRKTQRTAVPASTTVSISTTSTPTSTSSRPVTPVHFLVDRDIVSVAIGVLLPYAARPAPEGQTYQMTAMADFEDLVNASELRTGGLAVDTTAARFRVVLQDPTQFQQFVDYLSTSGSLSNSARMLYASTQPAAIGPFFDGVQVPAIDVGKFARYLCAINFQRISEIAKSAGGYSIGLKVAPIAPASFFEAQVEYCLHVQLRVFVDGEVTSFHLLSIPLNKRRASDPSGNTGVFEIAETALNAITPRWQDMMIAVISDSDGITAEGPEDPRLSLRNAVATRFESVAKAGFLRVCCAARRLDSLVQRFFSKILGGGEPYSTLTALLAYVGRQRVLLATMETSAPSIGDNRWRSVANVAMWFRRHGVSIREYLEREQSACAPPGSWWIRVTLAARIGQESIPILEEISGLTTGTSHPRDAVIKLRAFLVQWFSISDPLAVDDSAVDDAATRVNSSNLAISKDGKYSVTSEKVFAALEDLGTYIAEALQIPENGDVTNQSAVHSTVSEIATSVVNLVSGLTSITIDVDAVDPRLSELSAVLPHELVKMRGRQFTSIVQPQIQRLLLAGWSRQKIDWIEQDFQDLCGAYFREPSLKLALESCGDRSSFRDAWGCLQGRFSYLRDFCGIMATAYPGAAISSEVTGSAGNTSLQIGCSSLAPLSRVTSLPGSIESGVSDLSVQAALQAKQFRRLRAVRL
ncbi:hypothetical protein PHYSODRAFT_516823 [Phytophthora sojae]|uniref:Uncharacterized protein n=1 Tax=Phytophthora sojae (strain P6497) TaxID=1094619 RepID=G4ZW65_PHYSP|nr:hypothetical protein PHYSODRAFT_516823 [Phytophthora sojae]EGZ12347.1 hypothetical protein PHYSODRAFT_516823 [Phytophthora sojae]|eukprot:XP_009532680.1 hypothetical protein PHYSODRAFT_516823 [Phytophthora sojae]